MDDQANNNNEPGQNVKGEPQPLADENENTPLRDENVCSFKDPDAGPSNSGWNTDDEDSVAPPVTPPPPLINLGGIRRSPKCDNHATHQSTSNASENEDDIDNVLDSLLQNDCESLKPPPPPPFKLTELKRSPRFDVQSSPPENIANDQIDVKFKREEREELQLDFLDDLDVDMNGTETLVKIEPDSSANQRDEELEAITKMQREFLDTSNNQITKKDKKKKRKKEKKQKRERERSRSGSPSRSHKQRRLNESSRIAVKAESDELDFVPVNAFEQSVKIISPNKLRAIATVPAPPILGIMEKRKLAVERVKAVLQLMHRKASKIPETEFRVVDTIRKLPNSASVLSSARFVSPSPLCNNYNVNYKFNSTTKSNINLSKWGLEAMPVVTTKLLQVTGIDVTRLMELKKNSKMSMHKLRLQQQANKAASKTEDECISTGLFRSLSTQTDARNYTKTIAVQTKAISSQHNIFWLDSQFSESDLSQQQANVMHALKELCSTLPSSMYWADAIYHPLHNALKIKREEVKQLAMKKGFY